MIYVQASNRNARMKYTDRIIEILSKLGIPGPKKRRRSSILHTYTIKSGQLLTSYLANLSTAESFNPTSRIISP
jgi:hypothetical protein